MTKSVVIRAILFDLDDTLVPQKQWLDGAWNAVANFAALNFGIDPVRFERQLLEECALGSGRGMIFDRALQHLGIVIPIEPLVDVFVSYQPSQLSCYAGVEDALSRLRRKVPIGLVTDGNPKIQRSKITAAGLNDCFDVVVLSDLLGREHRKPDPAPFEAALRSLGCDGKDAVFVGDRPGTDIKGALRVGMRAIRVRTGEYSSDPDEINTWNSVANLGYAVSCMEQFLFPQK